MQKKKNNVFCEDIQQEGLGVTPVGPVGLDRFARWNQAVDMPNGNVAEVIYLAEKCRNGHVVRLTLYAIWINNIHVQLPPLIFSWKVKGNSIWQIVTHFVLFYCPHPYSHPTSSQPKMKKVVTEKKASCLSRNLSNFESSSYLLFGTPRCSAWWRCTNYLFNMWNA